MEKELRFTVGPLQRWLLLLCAVILGYVVTAVVSALMLGKGITASRVCVVTVIQDVMVFVIPALVTAVFITRRPADFLEIGHARFGALLLACFCLLSSVPFMNAVIEWNANLNFPAEIATAMKAMEDAAAKTIGAFVDGQSVMSLIVMLLVIGCFAGFSEELLFRGTIQRLLITGRMNPHLAIWLTAIIFSAFHIQFYGFVPRMLLGTMFGYFAWWFGSVWPAVAAHVLNNSLAVYTMWYADRTGIDADQAGVNGLSADNPWLIWGSVAAFLALIWFSRAYGIGERNKEKAAQV